MFKGVILIMISGLERIKTRFKCDVGDNLLSQIYAFLNSDKLTDDIRRLY